MSLTEPPNTHYFCLHTYRKNKEKNWFEQLSYSKYVYQAHQVISESIIFHTPSYIKRHHIPKEKMDGNELLSTTTKIDIEPG